MQPNDDLSATPPAAVPSRRLRVATILAWLALPVLAASALLFVLPVDNPGVQNCGSPVVYLLKAKPDRPLVNNDGTPINGWSTARLKAADAHRCAVTVPRRAVPAAILLLAFWVIAAVALIIRWVDRATLRACARSEDSSPPTPESSPEAPGEEPTDDGQPVGRTTSSGGPM